MTGKMVGGKLEFEPMPDWFLIIQYAKEFNLDPMDVEKKVSKYWWNRWLAYKKLVDEANKKEANNNKEQQ